MWRLIETKNSILHFSFSLKKVKNNHLLVALKPNSKNSLKNPSIFWNWTHNQGILSSLYNILYFKINSHHRYKVW